MREASSPKSASGPQAKALKTPPAGRRRRKPKPRPLTRSEVMARIKSQDTKPEMKVRRALWAAGYRYRVHDKTLPGSPDLAIKRLKAAIFVHGCFWHAHEGCPGFRPPKSRQEYWSAKLARNMARDKKVKEELEAEGWNVLVIWECGLKEPGWLESVLASLEELAKRPGGPSGPASVPY